ncbi:polyketide synthase dehydratase domain-containing protein [Streptomyces sp. M19]
MAPRRRGLRRTRPARRRPAGGRPVRPAPALLDSALHVSSLLDDDTAATGEGVALPFAWNGVALHTGGAAAARVRLARGAEDGTRLDLADATGLPLASVASFVTRPVTADRLGSGPRSLYTVELTRSSGSRRPPDPPSAAARCWARTTSASACPSTRPGLPRRHPPAAVLLPVGATDGDAPNAARAALGRVLRPVQQWLGDERYAAATLVVLTGGGLADASVRGMVRAAQAEDPGRIVLAELGAGPLTTASLAAVLDAGSPKWCCATAR